MWPQLLGLFIYTAVIIGNGDIASVLNDREGAVFFASGVSNSRCEDGNEFVREFELLNQTILKYGKTKCLFYFSSLSINFIDNHYTRHKAWMEKVIRQSGINYNIIRIGNITWGKNPNTFINYFQDRIEKDLPFSVFDEYRYLISKQELLLLTDNLPLTGKNEISVTGRIVKVQQIVNELIDEKRRFCKDHQ